MKCNGYLKSKHRRDNTEMCFMERFLKSTTFISKNSRFPYWQKVENFYQPHRRLYDSKRYLRMILIVMHLKVAKEDVTDMFFADLTMSQLSYQFRWSVCQPELCRHSNQRKSWYYTEKQGIITSQPPTTHCSTSHVSQFSERQSVHPWLQVQSSVRTSSERQLQNQYQ